jgi:hypothetical protein
MCWLNSAVDEEDGLQVRWVAANVLQNQSQTANSG